MRAGSRFTVLVTREARRVEQAQRLRHRVFADELGAQAHANGLDADAFDSHCEHLVVCAIGSDEVVATYRILSPEAARRAGRYYAERLFDLTMLDLLRDRMVEVGRACVHPEYRSGSLMLLMWSALSRYLIDNGHDYFFGSASVGLGDGGHAAASLYLQASERCLSPEDLRVFPRVALALGSLASSPPPEPPPLLRAYLNLGAWICGEPARDADFNCADFPVLLPLSRLHTRYARHFLERAA